MARTCLTRRFFILSGAMAASPVMAAVPSEGGLLFKAFRKGSEIGTHKVGFERSGADLEVSIAVDFAVGIGPITLYRYTLRGTEIWRQGQLMEARADTVDGGKKAWMRAARQQGKLMVEGSKTERYAAPEGSIVASHWNPAELQAPMVNLQNGELLEFAVEKKGVETIRARGRSVSAAHFSLTGPAVLNLWYDPGNVWSALRAVAEDGSVIEYQQS